MRERIQSDLSPGGAVKVGGELVILGFFARCSEVSSGMAGRFCGRLL